MAAPRRKQVKKYKFELTRAAIGGIGVVCFCIFLWMFLFGVWTGQSLLMPSSSNDFAKQENSNEQVVNLTNQKKSRPN